MADIQYLNYGDLQIELLAFLTKAANEVLKYVQSLPWSNKRKEKFMSAYSDIMSKGITGVSNATGLWLVNVGGNIDLDSKDRKDREMYQEAAYFIQQQMADLPTRASQEDEEKKKAEEEKSKLPLYNNFKDNFLGFINKTYFGNNPMRIGSGEEDDWNYLDERDSTGKRGTTKRANRLALYLEDYSKSLEEGKYNFEGSPYTDLNDLKSRINNAITYLKDGKIDLNDKDALNALGLKTSEYFNNGTGDLSGQFNSEGQELTYGQLAEYNAAQAKAKQQLAIELLKATRANQWDRLTFLGAKLNGKPLSAEHSTMEYLLGLASKANLSGDEASELVGAFKLAARTGQLLSLSKEELQKFGRFQGYSNPNRLRKINNLEGVYWDTIGNRIVRPYMSTNAPLTSFLDILDLNKPKTAEEKRIEAGNRKVNDGEWQTEDYLRMGAMGLDIAGTVAAFLPGYGTAASAGLGLTALGTNMAADIADDSVSAGLVVKNAAINLGLGVVGLVPGLGLASKTGKWVTLLAKWTPRLLTMAAAGQIVLDDDIKKSLAKVTSNETLTVNDWKNVGYALSTMAGLARGTRGIVDNRKYKAAFKEPVKTEKEYSITTSKGKTVKVSKELADKLSKIKSKDSEKINEEARKILNLSEDEKIDLKNNSWLGNKLKQTGIKIEETTKTTSKSSSSRVQAYLRALRMLNERRKSGQGIYKFAPRFLPTSYDIYSGAAKMLMPLWNITDKIKKAWDPVGKTKGPNVRNNSKTSPETSTSSETLPTITKFTPENRKNILKAQKEMEQILHPTKSRKAIKTNDKGEANIEANINGEKISINYNSKTNELKINNGTPTKVKDGFEVRQKILSEILERRKLSRINARQNKSKNEFKIDILELRKLKKAGFLKQGGTIDKLKIQKYKEYIKK